MNLRGGSLFITKNVGELLYDGYEDPFLTYLKEADSPIFRYLLKIYGTYILQLQRLHFFLSVPFDKFGWFVDRNGSWSYDGNFNMNTGEVDITTMGKLNKWNDESTTKFYSGGCSAINGTTGEIWPPKLNPERDITLFVSDICRSVSLAPTKDTVTRHGVDGAKWIGDERVFDNGENYPPNQCFCTGAESECPDLAPGVYNISDCRFGAPAFISYPHFYLADPSYALAVDGLNASQEKHEFSISLEPNTGIPVEVNAKMQVNVLLQPITGLTYV